MSTDRSVNQSPQASFQIFYEQNCWQIILFSILSGGIYQLVWSYRFWRHFKRNALNGEGFYLNDSRVNLILSVVFFNLYLFGACRRVEKQLRASNHTRYRMHGWFCFSTGVIAGLFELISPYYGFNELASLLISIFWGAGINVWIQHNANIANQISGQSKLPRPLPKKDFLWGVIGALIVLGAIAGNEEPESIYSECMTQMRTSEFSIKDQQTFCKCTQAQFNQYSEADPEKVMKYCLFDLPGS